MDKINNKVCQYFCLTCEINIRNCDICAGNRNKNPPICDCP